MNPLRVEAGASNYYLRRRRQARARRIRRIAFLSGALLVVGVLTAGFVYGGSSGRIAAGVKIDGVDVGGLSTAAAVRLLEQKEAALGGVPITVHVAGHRLRVTAAQLGVRLQRGRFFTDVFLL